MSAEFVQLFALARFGFHFGPPSVPRRSRAIRGDHRQMTHHPFAAPTFRKGLRGDNCGLTGIGQMAKTATRGRRKAPARGKSKAGSSGGGLLPWAVIGIAAIAGIAAYDNWKSIRPMLARESTPITRETAEPRPAARKDTPPKQVALATPTPTPKSAPLMAQPLPQPLPPATIPTPSVQPVKATPTSASPAVPETGAGKVAFGYCGQGAHINCVGDGGVFWYKGEKIVIADMASPVADQARCADERRVAFAAKSRLLALLNAGPFTMNAAGKADPSGASRVVSRDGRSFGGQLINEGLARKPGVAGGAWCA